MSDDGCDLLCLDLPLAEELRGRRLATNVAEDLAAGARALGDPTRLTVAAALADARELCVCDLSWICERSENLVSHHVRQLRAAGLAASRRDGKMVMYSLTPAGRALLEAVLAPAERAPS
ncbi:MAG: winged helix-turn-helix transcriptional regulator [Solirubrobacterales bacterium]|nr:winged helix-turn-helix transcriptional regulator [Solirubrobacterales bacterium]